MAEQLNARDAHTSRSQSPSKSMNAPRGPGACLKRVRAVCDCWIKVSIITFPIFFIASMLVGAIVMVRARAIRKPPADSALLNANLKDLNPTIDPDEEMDNVDVYGFVFFILAGVSLVIIFLGRCVTSKIPPPAAVQCRVDRDTGMHLQV